MSKKELNLKINGKSILDKLDGYNDRDKTSLYISKGLLKRFKTALGDRSASQAIELLMDAFLETVDKKN